MMDAPKPPKPPEHLLDAGRALWADVHAGVAEGWALDVKDLGYLRQACGLADTVAALEEAVGDVGLLDEDGKVTDATKELRLTRALLTLTLKRVEIEPPMERTGHLSKRQRDQLRNARAVRWGRPGQKVG